MLERVTESGLVIPEHDLEIPEAFLRAFPAKSVTGPRLDLLGDPVTETVVMRCTWDVENRGDAEGIAGLRVNLQIDAAFGDFSQLIIEVDGSKAGALARVAVVRPLTNTPVAIAPGGTERLMVDFDISVLHMLDRQGSLAGFNWWIAEITAWDVEADALAAMEPDLSEARYEIRDWFRIVTAPPAADLVAAADAVAAVTLETIGM